MTKTTAPHCPQCKTLLNGITGAESGQPATLKPGLLCTCIHCGSAIRLNTQLEFELIPKLELNAMLLADHKLKTQYDAAIKHHKQYREYLKTIN